MACADLLVVGQIRILEDHLDDGAAGVGHMDDCRDVGLDIGVATRLERPDLDDHIELDRSVLERLARLEHLRRRRLTTVGETDDRADGDVGVVKKRRCPDHVDGAHADRGHVVLGSQPAAVLDERVVEFGAQQRVVDRLRDVALGQGVERHHGRRHLM